MIATPGSAQKMIRSPVVRFMGGETSRSTSLVTGARPPVIGRCGACPRLSLYREAGDEPCAIDLGRHCAVAEVAHQHSTEV